VKVIFVGRRKTRSRALSSACFVEYMAGFWFVVLEDSTNKNAESRDNYYDYENDH
jgi:hypothetical protein